MQDAHDVVRLAAPERHARVGRGQHLAHDLARRQVRLDGPHLGAVDHHVRHLELLEIEQAAQHVALALADGALLVQQVDLAADLLRRREACAGAQRDAEHSQDLLDRPFHREGERIEDFHRERERPGDLERETVRIIDGDRLRQDFREDDDEH